MQASIVRSRVALEFKNFESRFFERIKAKMISGTTYTKGQ